ncbi:MAG: chemotaxis protein CheX [Thermodesulfobacteriota bacterium]|nr:chemotaxis protein CheX [Thermodesulfobacteriota bacterium]
MDVKLINPFIDATLHVLETIASTSAMPGKPYLKKDKVARGDVSGVIGLTGDVKGTISVSFTEKSILSIVSRMFGEEIEKLNEEIQDAVGEITNMISGQARQKLEELGRSLDAAIPTVVMGTNHSITHITNQHIVAIPFDTDKGRFTIEVCFEA